MELILNTNYGEDHTIVAYANGRMYTAGYMLRKTAAYISLFKLLNDIFKGDTTVGIAFDNEFENLIAATSAMFVGCNVSILPSNESREEVSVKLASMQADILMSNIFTDINILTVDQNFNTVVESRLVRSIVPDFFDLRMIFLKILKENLFLKRDEAIELINNHRVWATLKQKAYISFHGNYTMKGSPSPKASIFNCFNLFDTWNHMETVGESKGVLFLEPLSRIYNVSAAIRYLSNGIPLVFGDLTQLLLSNNNDSSYTYDTIYCHYDTLSNILMFIESGLSNRSVRLWTMLTGTVINKDTLIRRRFRSIFGKSLSLHCIGKVKKELSFLTKLFSNIYNFYVMSEVATFLAFAKESKRRIELLCNVSNRSSILNEKYADNDFCRVYVNSTDMHSGYLSNDIEMMRNSISHPYTGYILTDDVSRLENYCIVGKIHDTVIVGKSIVEEEQLKSILKPFHWIKSLKIVSKEGKLIVLLYIDIYQDGFKCLEDFKAEVPYVEYEIEKKIPSMKGSIIVAISPVIEAPTKDHRSVSFIY